MSRAYSILGVEGTDGFLASRLGPQQTVSAAAIRGVEAELEIIFGMSGMKVLVKEIESRGGVNLSDALRRPKAFESALATLLGDLGSSLVMGRISKRVWSLDQGMKSTDAVAP